MSSPWFIERVPLSSDELPQSTEVCVIGAGLAGLCCALFLARAGAKVTLLESGAGLGEGGSAREHGGVYLGVVEHPYRIVHALGVSGASDLYAFSRSSQERLGELVTVTPSGSLWIALDERERNQVERSCRALRELGYPAEVLSDSAVANRLGAQGCGNGLWLANDGLVDPGDCLESLALQAREAGARLIFSHPVRGIEQSLDGLDVRGQDETLLKTEVVIVAAGARSSQVDSWFEDKIVPVREQALLTHPVSQLIPGANRAGYGYTHFRQVRDGGLLIGGCRWATPHMEYGEVDDQVIVDRIQEKLQATVGRLFPEMGELQVRRRWAWLNARTCDMLPIIGPLPGNPRVIACTGFVGNPYGLAPQAASAVAQGLMGEGSPEVPSFMSAQRFL